MLDPFHYRADRLFAEELPVDSLAERYETPLFVYSARALRTAYARLAAALPGNARVLFSVKANSNPHVVSIFRECGAGAELASIGELVVARAAGVPSEDMVFAGPGKRDHELRAWIESSGGVLNVESVSEAVRADRIAGELERRVTVGLRVNPAAPSSSARQSMGGKPLPFGVDEEQLATALTAIDALPHLVLAGLHVFVGTQILDAVEAASVLARGVAYTEVFRRVTGRACEILDVGLGLGVPTFPGDVAVDLDALRHHLADAVGALDGSCQLRFEAGRFLAAEAGLYVVSVIEVKESRGTRYVITDGGMHHHPAASGGFGNVFRRPYPLLPATRGAPDDERPSVIVGPLCTAMDRFGTYAVGALVPGDLLAVGVSGAYGFSCGHLLFLSHPTPAEIVVDGDSSRLVREPASTAGLLATPTP